MVAVKTPTVSEVYSALCGVLKQQPGLSVHVVNHIAAKHGVHSLPAFHTSDAVTDEQKLATYGELARALTAHIGGKELNGKPALANLKGQVANGQAGEEEKPKIRQISDIPSFRTPAEDTPSTEPVARVTLPEPKPEKKPEPKPVAKLPSDPLTDRLRELLREIIGELPAALDEEKVRSIAHVCSQKQAAAEVQNLRDELEKHKDAVTSNVGDLIASALAGVKPMATRVEIKIGDAIRPVDGLAHFQMTQLATWLAADVPVWTWGGAGSGKTHLGRQLAAALGLKFYSAAIDETITVGKLVGFRNVSNGEFVEGLIYRAYKEGGVQQLDEIDTNATAMAALNSLLANDHYTFPNGEEVARHKDFRVLACANTKGTGAVAGYTARVRLDAATLDRFAVIELLYDEGLEVALTTGVPNRTEPWRPVERHDIAALREGWVKWVQAARKAVAGSALISPRASYLGVRALAAGVPPAEVADALVFKLVTQDTRQRIISAAGSPSVL